MDKASQTAVCDEKLLFKDKNFWFSTLLHNVIFRSFWDNVSLRVLQNRSRKNCKEGNKTVQLWSWALKSLSAQEEPSEDVEVDIDECPYLRN
jgi:hypothetical protein